MLRSSFLLPFLIRLVILIACIAPFAMGKNTVTVVWQHKTYSLSLAVAVFIAIVVFMIIQAVVMQFYDFGTSFRRFRTQRLERRLRLAGRDIELFLSHNANGDDTRTETKRLSQSLASRHLVDWGELNTALRTLAKIAPEKAESIEAKRILQLALRSYRRLQRAKAFSSPQVEAQVLWRISLFSSDLSLRDDARSMMFKHDQDNEDFCLYESRRALAAGNWRRSRELLLDHRKTAHFGIARAWLDIANRALNETEKQLGTQGQKEDKTDSASTNTDLDEPTGTALQPANYIDAESAISEALSNATACDPQVKSDTEFLIPTIALKQRSKQIKSTIRFMKSHARDVASDDRAAVLWLRLHDLELSVKSGTRTHDVHQCLQEWIDHSARHPNAILTFISIMYEMDSPSLGEAFLEELLEREDELTPALRSRMMSILVKAGTDTHPYLKRLLAQTKTNKDKPREN